MTAADSPRSSSDRWSGGTCISGAASLIGQRGVLLVDPQRMRKAMKRNSFTDKESEDLRKHHSHHKSTKKSTPCVESLAERQMFLFADNSRVSVDLSSESPSSGAHSSTKRSGTKSQRSPTESQATRKTNTRSKKYGSEETDPRQNFAGPSLKSSPSPSKLPIPIFP